MHTYYVYHTFSCLCREGRVDAAAGSPAPSDDECDAAAPPRNSPVMFWESDIFAAGVSDDVQMMSPVTFEQSDAFAAGDFDAAGSPVMFEVSDAAAISLSEDDRLEL